MKGQMEFESNYWLHSDNSLSGRKGIWKLHSTLGIGAASGWGGGDQVWDSPSGKNHQTPEPTVLTPRQQTCASEILHKWFITQIWGRWGGKIPHMEETKWSQKTGGIRAPAWQPLWTAGWLSAALSILGRTRSVLFGSWAGSKSHGRGHPLISVGGWLRRTNWPQLANKTQGEVDWGFLGNSSSLTENRYFALRRPLSILPATLPALDAVMTRCRLQQKRVAQRSELSALMSWAIKCLFLTHLTTPGAGGRRERESGGGGKHGETESPEHQQWKHKQAVILENTLAVLVKWSEQHSDSPPTHSPGTQGF